MAAESFEPRYVVDASIWVSAVVPQDAFHRQSRLWIREQVDGLVDVACPTIVLAEVAGAVSRRLDSNDAGDKAANDVEQLSIVVLFGLNPKPARDAAHLAAALHLRGADAVYVALAQRLAIPLLTWDREMLDRAAAVIDVRTPPAP